MAATRLSQLQKRILRWVAVDAQHTKGVVASSHPGLVRALKGEKGEYPVIASAPWKRRAGLSLTARPVGKPNP